MYAVKPKLYSFSSDEFKPCPDGWEYFHHSLKCYKMFKSKKTMADAEAHCREKSGGKVRSLKLQGVPFCIHFVGGTTSFEVGMLLQRLFRFKAKGKILVYLHIFSIPVRFSK